MSIEKSVLEKLLKLPADKQKEVLEFVDSIWRKHRGLKSQGESEISKAEQAAFSECSTPLPHFR